MLYDNIGTAYSRYRRPDPRIAAAVTAALGRSATVVNVGAGAGSYEPSDRVVVAVEPSVTMIRQRAPGTAPVVQASALHLPFRDKSFAAALAVLTVHHWADRRRGLSELVRAARDRIVIVTFEPAAAGFWLVDEYFPAVRDVIRRSLPALDEIREVLGSVQVHPLLIPHDCTDGFLCAYWRRPEAYLDAGVRRAISAFANVPAADAGIERLRRDLQDGTWYQRHRDLVTKDSLDLGYRLIVAEPVPRSRRGGPGVTDQLARFRAQIDELDRRWVRVLAARFAVTGQVGRYKKRHHLSIVDDQREYEQCVRIRQLAVAEGLDPDVAERFLRCILEEVVRRHAAPTKAE